MILFNRIEDDLKSINKSETPWIVVYSHYPIFCSDMTDKLCSSQGKSMNGINNLMKLYNVSLYISGHEHAYERIKYQSEELYDIEINENSEN